jgi:FkbM family methyltransferase
LAARRGGEVWIDDFDGDLVMGVDLSDHIGSQIYWRGSHSDDALAVLASVLRDDSTFLDVGANIGEFTLFAAKRVPRGWVHAFEPGPEQRRRLEANVEANALANVTVSPCALGDRRETAALWVPRVPDADGTVNRGKSTMMRGNAQDLSAVPIEVRILDEYVRESGISRVDCVKIDVEGSEQAVLAGAREVLERDHPTLLVELNGQAADRAGWSIPELVSGIERLGYTPHTLGSGGRSSPGVRLGGGNWANVLFLPRSEGP